jgi:hypothetical protein
MHQYWFAVRCGWFFGAFRAPDAEAAASLALLCWVRQREGSPDSLLPHPVTVVVPAGGRSPEDYLHLRTHDRLRRWRLLPSSSPAYAGRSARRPSHPRAG